MTKKSGLKYWSIPSNSLSLKKSFIMSFGDKVWFRNGIVRKSKFDFTKIPPCMRAFVNGQAPSIWYCTEAWEVEYQLMYRPRHLTPVLNDKILPKITFVLLQNRIL
ncbi:hypothetical protein AVEN_204850-1 [Araneus ventricosus]|uniref:Uncharacterized protein n=1 Tax=Araneus ventricosus TaxID=182803 RepID=A0A4Y2VM10_ARAVE|nr:hypothetical protein AVEN_204850-1 [Araneus ventricosus]